MPHIAHQGMGTPGISQTPRGTYLHPLRLFCKAQSAGVPDILFFAVLQSWTGLLIVGLVFVYHYLVTDPKAQRL